MAFLTLLAMTYLTARASEPVVPPVAARPAALAAANTTEFVFTALPLIAKPGQARTIFLQQIGPGCPGLDVTLDASLVESQDTLVIRNRLRSGICPGVPTPPVYYRFAFEYTPTKIGTLKIRNEASLSDIDIQTVSVPVASKFDVNGMWFDPATNGSGIAMHHSRGKTDAAFGTWFLFNDFVGRPIWYTMQRTAWTQDGSVLEGLLYTVEGGCADPTLAGCPGIGSITTPSPSFTYPYWETPTLVRITFQSAFRARAEAVTLWVTVLFTSELTKVQF